MILYVGHYIFSEAKREGKIKHAVPKLHQASVINKHRLNIIGVKGYGYTIKVVVQRGCPNITSTAKRKISIPAFKNKLMWMGGKYFSTLLILFGSYRNTRPELCVSLSSQFLLTYDGTKWDVNVHISAYHPKAVADNKISKNKFYCSGNGECNGFNVNTEHVSKSFHILNFFFNSL